MLTLRERVSWRRRRLTAALDQRPHRTPGHAWFCDCPTCMADDGREQRTRLHGCPCKIPASCCPPRAVMHDDPSCPRHGETVMIGERGPVAVDG